MPKILIYLAERSATYAQKSLRFGGTIESESGCPSLRDWEGGTSWRKAVPPRTVASLRWTKNGNGRLRAKAVAACPRKRDHFHRIANWRPKLAGKAARHPAALAVLKSKDRSCTSLKGPPFGGPFSSDYVSESRAAAEMARSANKGKQISTVAGAPAKAPFVLGPAFRGHTT